MAYENEVHEKLYRHKACAHIYYINIHAGKNSYINIYECIFLTNYPAIIKEKFISRRSR